MFSKDIVGSDAFLDMPSSSQLLYFHLGMEADDDGFISSPKRIQKYIGCNDDDLKILLSKRFLLQFPSGVVVVKHHRINNNWDSYNCKRTLYEEEFSSLSIKENKAYTLDKTQGIAVQTENRLKPVFRIEENRIDKKRREETIKGGVLFSEFWSLYPKKVEKKKAEYKWGQLSEETQKKILIDLPLRCLGNKWKKEKGRYVENPLTYLNGERWEDEIETSITQKTITV